MSLSNTTLSAIQQAGTAVFAADVELKTAVRDYAERVQAALADNPYSLGNDTMFETWKVLARLSQTMVGIEEELKKIYHVAANLIADDQPLLVQASALEAPTPAVDALEPAQDNLTPTDVVAKTRKRTSKPVPKKPAAMPANAPAASSNTAKLVQHLQTVLNKNKFSPINQTLVAQNSGIPLGSMTAAIKKAIELGLIVAGPAGSLKLGKTQ